MRRTLTCLLAALFSAPVLAQSDGTYLLVSTNTVSPSTPTTTIEFWAAWADPRVEWIFGAGNFDLTAGDGVFSNAVIMRPGFGFTTGVIAGNVISGAVLGQVHWPQVGLIGSRDNPILLATYDWTTTDFTPRTVSLDTSNTSAFNVQRWWMLPGPPPKVIIVRLYPHEFTPGSGVINVIPAPAAWFALALPLATATRRRRRS